MKLRSVHIYDTHTDHVERGDLRQSVDGKWWRVTKVKHTPGSPIWHVYGKPARPVSA